MAESKQPYFGLRGTALTAWLTVACATDMTLFGYDQGVFSESQTLNGTLKRTTG